ncbi:MAG TPA: HEPN domain-containing protein [bacterium]|nr:HEPN domain-containing protein [bacterium]
MSIEITLHPRKASIGELKDFLKELGFQPTEHLWAWPKGSLHFHWFEKRDFISFDGVEATIFPPSRKEQKKLGRCAHALHTRTRLSASHGDIEMQNRVIRLARVRFGGNFYNDWYGNNRYTKVDSDSRDATARGIYLAYEFVTDKIRSVRFSLPSPTQSLEKFVGTKQEDLAKIDPKRVLYNALIPFAVAALEHFFGQCFKILLQYDPKAQLKLRQQSRKIDIADVLAIQAHQKTVEDVVADWYSFQSIASIHSAFSDWFGIDFWKLLRRRKKVGKKLPILEKHLDYLIQTRHGIVHRLSIDVGLTKEQIEEILDLAQVVIDTLVDHLEISRGCKIRG